ncbi:MAG TPA: macro domain-containing protein [Phycisphaerales bacterium]
MELGTGDILKADVEALVNTVNCVGVMGRGIALQFKNKFPANFKAYKAACDKGGVQPGRMLVYDLGPLNSPRWIINFPTKRHWKGKSQIEDIQAGLLALKKEIEDRGIASIALPPLGCGLGGLDWTDVRPLIERALGNMPNLRVVLFEPAAAPAAADMAASAKAPNMTPGRAALIGLVRRYLEAVMDPFVSLLEVHKLMYFMQVAGEPLNLRYKKALYGPYSENLGHVLKHVEGHFLSGYGDGSDDPEKQLQLLPHAVEQAEAFLAAHPESRERFDRVCDLTGGFESAYGMELLATVHWVTTNEHANSPSDAVRLTHDWNTRKSMFPDEHIKTAWNVLKKKGWA